MLQRVLHLSDLHIGRRKVDAKNLRKVVSNIVKQYGVKKNSGKDLTILITGDLVNDGRKGQFKECRRILEPLYKHFDVFTVPGNHDYGTWGNHAEAARFQHFKAAFYGLENVTYPHVKVKDHVIFIGLNSMKAEAGPIDGWLADGELGKKKQLHNLSGLLNRIDGLDPKPRIVVHLHHHPFNYPGDSWLELLGEWLWHELKDGDVLMKLLAGRADVLLFGHEHRHLDFTGTTICRDYRIPYILSAGKTTEKAPEYELNSDGTPSGKKLHTGMLGRLLEIPKKGEIKVRTVVLG